MAYTIVTKKRFLNKVKNLQEYLLTNWLDVVEADFMKKLDDKIKLLAQQPFIGIETSINNKIRTTLITKHNRIYYKIEGNNVIILNMIDTRRNPKTNPFIKPT